MADEVAKIAASLTKARRAMLFALPAGGSWGAVPSRSVAKRAWWSTGLIRHKHRPEDRNEWALTPSASPSEHTLRSNRHEGSLV